MHAARTVRPVVRPEHDDDTPTVALFVSTSLSGSDQAVWSAFWDSTANLRRLSSITGRWEYTTIARPGIERGLASELARRGRIVRPIERDGTMRDLYAVLAHAAAAIVIWDGEDQPGLLTMHELESRGLPFVAAIVDPLTGRWEFVGRKAPWVPYVKPVAARPLIGHDLRDKILPTDGLEGEPRELAIRRLLKATFFQPAGVTPTTQVDQLLALSFESRIGARDGLDGRYAEDDEYEYDPEEAPALASLESAR